MTLWQLTHVYILQRDEEASQLSEVGTPTWSAIADEPMDYSQRGPFGDAVPRQEPSARRVSQNTFAACSHHDLFPFWPCAPVYVQSSWCLTRVASCSCSDNFQVFFTKIFKECRYLQKHMHACMHACKVSCIPNSFGLPHCLSEHACTANDGRSQHLYFTSQLVKFDHCTKT